MERVEDPYVFCPYNQNHFVPRSRLQQHIVKCEKNYPTLAICPYNATHRYPHDKIKDHIAVCPTKEQVEEEEKPTPVTANLMAPQPIPTREYLKEGDEDYESWD